MDQEPRTAGQELADEPGSGSQEDRTPEQVRREIEQTRVELGDTVAALAEKTDVKAQARHAVDDTKATVSGKVSELKDTLTGRKDELISAAQQATPESAGDAGQRVTTFARQNPLPLTAAAAFAVGLLIGGRRGR